MLKFPVKAFRAVGYRLTYLVVVLGCHRIRTPIIRLTTLATFATVA